MAYEKGRGEDVVINGQLANRKQDAIDFFANARSTAEIQALFEWLPTVGMGFMVGVGTQTALLLQSAMLKIPIHRLAWPASFSGELPVLSATGLNRPELFLALQEKSASSAFPGAYQDVLCWVDQRVFDDSPTSFDPFKASQHLELTKVVYGRGAEYIQIPFSQVTEGILAEVSQRFIDDGYVGDTRAAWDYEALDLRTVPLDPSNLRNNLVLGYQANEPLKHGFGHLPGHVLCRTTVDVLSQYVIGAVQAENLSKAKSFADSYFPIDLLMAEAEQDGLIRPDCLRGYSGMVFSRMERDRDIRAFYAAFGDDSPIQACLQKGVPAPLLNYIFGYYCTVDLDVQSMIALNQGVGLDNTGFSLDLDYRCLQALRDVGFRFSDFTEISKSSVKPENGGHYHHRARSDDTSVLLDMASTPAKNAHPNEYLAWNNRFANALAMNLWPVRTAKPESVSKALSTACRKKKWSDTPEESSLLAYLDHAGIDACASAAKTTAHWVFIKNHFGREAVEPYFKNLTRQARGHLLEDDLGM